MKPIAIQLYTLRPDTYPAGANDFPGILRTVAEIGFKGVEFAGLYGHDPKEIGKILADLGLEACSSHTGMPTFENVQQMADTELAYGNKRVISGFGPDDFKTEDACKATAAKFQQAAELLKPYSLAFGFHSHWWEFNRFDGKYAYDIVLAEAPDVFSELDVYWCAYGHADPIETVAKNKSRLPILHIKDGMLQEGVHVHTAVGSGKMDMDGIIRAADPDVLQWLVVELDACETDMLEAVRKSYDYLTSKGLAAGSS